MIGYLLRIAFPLGLMIGLMVAFAAIEGIDRLDHAGEYVGLITFPMTILIDGVKFNTPLVIFTAALALAAAAGRVDLSIASIAAVAIAVMARFTDAEAFWVAAVPAAAAVAALLGAVNAVAIGWLRLSSVIVTLITLALFRLLAMMIWPSGPIALFDLAPGFNRITGSGPTLLVYLAALFALLVAPAWWLTRRRCAADPASPRRASTLALYGTTALLAVAAAILQAAREGMPGAPTALLGVELQALAALLIARVNLAGRPGAPISMAAAFLGACCVVLILEGTRYHAPFVTWGVLAGVAALALLAHAFAARWAQRKSLRSFSNRKLVQPASQ